MLKPRPRLRMLRLTLLRLLKKGDIDSGALVFQAEYEAELLRAMLAARLRRGWRDRVWDWAQDWA